MRAFQILAMMLCLCAGLYLLWAAPAFYMPDRWEPHTGRYLDALSSRLLGAGLLCVAAAGWSFMRQRYYNPSARHAPMGWHYRYFALLASALALINAAWLHARPMQMPAPLTQSRPPAP